ncbi:hypothetical protein FB565_003715 [Actinoplanes lutulentus]|uniref:Uncharacterized protein n=1 Tax=Actinoplanes lutulentus TaxID=1287878 RepID=A0A327ZKK1_9ACTN|nr:hypothetical protein [Actinoplanes lutulentus]MBB2943986.1 hypothetical protein [Actinoplanes lutulentus]RAK42781.1 hypothetical protein B0I29_102607 [Actinoplanes lutulentus]
MIVLVLVAAALLLGSPPPAYAHPMPDSAVVLEMGESSVSASIRIPAEELMLASGADVRSYLSAHLRPVTEDGVPWQVSIDEVGTEQSGSYREVVASARLTPPGGGAVGRFVLGYDAVVHQVATHVVVVSVRVRGGLREVGVVRMDNRTMTIPPLVVDVGGGGRGAVSSFGLDAEQVAELAVAAVAAAAVVIGGSAAFVARRRRTSTS